VILLIGFNIAFWLIRSRHCCAASSAANFAHAMPSR
jgi:hypothetical protein